MIIDFSLIILILFSDPAQPAGWDTTDVVLESLAVGAVLADWMSTKAVLEQGNVETNPLLDSRPTDEQLATFFVANIAYNLIVPLLLPKDVRAEWFGRSMAHLHPLTPSSTYCSRTIHPFSLKAKGISPHLW